MVEEAEQVFENIRSDAVVKTLSDDFSTANEGFDTLVKMGYYNDIKDYLANKLIVIKDLPKVSGGILPEYITHEKEVLIYHLGCKLRRSGNMGRNALESIMEDKDVPQIAKNFLRSNEV